MRFLPRKNDSTGEHLYAWFYKRLSRRSHLSWSGLVQQAGPLPELRGELHKIHGAERDEGILKKKCDLMFTFGAPAKQRLSYLWTIIGEYWPEAREVYELRYRALVAGNSWRRVPGGSKAD